MFNSQMNRKKHRKKKEKLTKSRRRKGTSLVVQWLRIHLPMQGTQV